MNVTCDGSLLPTHVCQFPSDPSNHSSALRTGVALQSTRTDTKGNASSTEEGEGQIKVPGGDGRAASEMAIALDQLALRRDARAAVALWRHGAEPLQRLVLWLEVEHGRVVSEVAERVPQRGQLPVQHCDHARLRGVEDQVLQAEIAVHHRA